MRPLALVVATAGGRGRAALIAACTAFASGLLLVAVSMARIGMDTATSFASAAGSRPDNLFGPLADPGTRGGTIFGVVVLTVPILALLNQGIRLGTTSRRARYDALAVAGATGPDLRRWAALEVGAPASVGAVLGVGVWWLLRVVLGTGLANREIGALVPTGVGPGLWTVPVVLGVAAAGFVAGALSIRPRRPAGATVRFPVLSMLVLVLGGSLFVFAVTGAIGAHSGVIVPVLVLVPLGLTGLTPWLTWRTARGLAERTSSPALLLAARRLSLDPRPAARAALASGAAGLTLGIVAMFVTDVASLDPTSRRDYLDPALLVAALAGLAFLLVGISLAVHITDTVMAGRRAYAALSATGFPTTALVAALRWETLMATLPVALLGCVLGIVGYGPLLDTPDRWWAWAAAAVLGTVAAVVVSSVAASGLLAPVVRQAAGSGTVRTE